MTQYLRNLDGIPPSASEQVASIEVSTVKLNGEADWDLDDLLGRSILHTRTILHVNYGYFREAFLLVNESVPLLVRIYYHRIFVDKRKWVRNPFWMCVSMLQNRCCRLSNKQVGVSETQLVCETSDLTAAVAELSYH